MIMGVAISSKSRQCIPSEAWKFECFDVKCVDVAEVPVSLPCLIQDAVVVAAIHCVPMLRQLGANNHPTDATHDSGKPGIYLLS